MHKASSHLLKSAVCHSDSLSASGIQERLFHFWFDALVYNQIWEDPRVDLEALALTPSSRVLCISSAGCNVLNYLLADPAHILAVDLNARHMALTRLKLAAAARLPDEEAFWRFFGLADVEGNAAVYVKYLRDHLDPATRAFWDARRWFGLGKSRIHLFEENFYDHARMGVFLRLLHGLCRLLGHEPAEILKARDIMEQEALFEEHVAPFFDWWLTRFLSRLPLAVFSLGIPPRQFEQMRRELGPDGLVADFKRRARKLIAGFPLSDNYFAWQVLGRSYDPSRRAVPEYLRAEHFETLRERVDRVETRLCSVTQALSQENEASLDAYVLLDSQDWMPPEVIEEQWREIDRTARPGARVIFRSAGSRSPVEQALPRSLRERFDYDPARGEALLAADRSAIYGGFHLYVKKG